MVIWETDEELKEEAEDRKKVEMTVWIERKEEMYNTSYLP